MVGECEEYMHMYLSGANLIHCMFIVKHYTQPKGSKFQTNYPTCGSSTKTWNSESGNGNGITEMEMEYGIKYQW